MDVHKKKVAKPYSKGELNKLIDSLCHPLFKTDKGFILVDGLLHGLAEQNPPVTIRKFVKYNLPTLLEQIEKKTKEKQSSEHSSKRIDKLVAPPAHRVHIKSICTRAQEI